MPQDLTDIPVHSASMVAAPKSSGLETLIGAIQGGVQLGKAAAVDNAKEETRSIADQISSEVELITGGAEKAASAEMSDRAKRMKAMYDQGRLTSTGVQIELENELRAMSRKWGGLYGNSIYDTAVNELGFDPKNAKLRYQLDQLNSTSKKGIDDKLRSLGVANSDIAYVAGRVTRGESLDKVMSDYYADAKISYDIDRKIKMMDGTKADDRIALSAVSDLTNQKLSRIMDSDSEIVKLAKTSLSSGKTIDLNEYKSAIAAVKDQIVQQVMSDVTSRLPNTYSLPQDTTDTIVNIIDNRFKYLESGLESIDRVKVTEDKVKYQSALAKSLAPEIAPVFYTVKEGLGPEAAAYYLGNGELAESMFPGLSRYTKDRSGKPYSTKQRAMILGYITAKSMGDETTAADIHIADPSITDDLDGKLSQEGKTYQDLFESYVEPEKLAFDVGNTSSSRQDRVSALERLSVQNPDKAIAMLSDYNSFNGIANDNQASDAIQGAIASKLQSIASEFTGTQFKFPDAGYDWIVDGRNRYKESVNVLDKSVYQMISEGYIDIGFREAGSTTKVSRDTLVFKASDMYKELIGDNTRANNLLNRQLDKLNTGELGSLFRMINKANDRGLSRLVGVRNKDQLMELVRQSFDNINTLTNPPAPPPTSDRNAEIERLYNKYKGGSNAGQ